MGQLAEHFFFLGSEDQNVLDTKSFKKSILCCISNSTLLVYLACLFYFILFFNELLKPKFKLM